MVHKSGKFLIDQNRLKKFKQVGIEREKGLENLTIFIKVKPAICFTMPMLNDIC